MAMRSGLLGRVSSPRCLRSSLAFLGLRKHHRCPTLLRGGANRPSTSSSFRPTVGRRRRRITYLTDVEGDRDYLTRYVEQSKVLCFRPYYKEDDSTAAHPFFFPYDHYIDFLDPTNSTDAMNDKDFPYDASHLVYGGDVWDQGGSDLYVIRQLLQLKQRYPDRVWFVMGNRDVNKMRVHQELMPSDESADSDSLLLPESPGVYWLRGKGIPGDPDLGQSLPSSAVERLQWMLRNTMGSPRAFEYRKQELQKETSSEDYLVTDEDVVESYRRSCHPVKGEMGFYLGQADLAVRLGQALFVHGSLPLTDDILSRGYRSDFWEDLTFCMPWLANTRAGDIGVQTLEDWVNHLNAFARRHVRAWQEETSSGVWSVEGGYNQTGQPYGNLIQYGMGWTPDGKRNPTIVYNSWSTNGMPRRFFPENNSTKDAVFHRLTRDFFSHTGVRLICSGHQPQGDMPNPIRICLPDEESDAWILSCDTSYSGDTMWYPDDDEKRSNVGRQGALSGRGPVAVSEVIIEQCVDSGEVLDVTCHGTLSDTSSYQTQGLTSTDTDGTLVVGALAPTMTTTEQSSYNGPWWTRAALEGGRYLLSAGQGYDMWNRIVRP